MEHLKNRTNGVQNDPARHTAAPAQLYAGTRPSSSQQMQTGVHGSDHSSKNMYSSRHDNRNSAYNPFSSALADIFGLDEAYS